MEINYGPHIHPTPIPMGIPYPRQPWNISEGNVKGEMAGCRRSSAERQVLSAVAHIALSWQQRMRKYAAFSACSHTSADATNPPLIAATRCSVAYSISCESSLFNNFLPRRLFPRTGFTDSWLFHESIFARWFFCFIYLFFNFYPLREH